METWRTYALDEILDLGPQWSVYRGRNLNSGKTVLVHLVAPGVPQSQTASIAKELRNKFLNSPDLRGVLLEFGQAEGFHGLVTEYVAGALKASKESIPSAPAPEEAEAPVVKKPPPVESSSPFSEAKPSQATSEPGEFTRMFRTISNAQPRPATETTDPGTAEPGEFTRMFRTFPASPKANPVADSPAKPAPAPLAPTRPLQNEASNLEAFQSEPGEGSPRPNSSEPDEFSRFHRVPDFDSAVPLKLPVLEKKQAPKDPLEDWLRTNPAPAPKTATQILTSENSVSDVQPHPEVASRNSKAPSEFSGFIARSSEFSTPLPPAAKFAPEVAPQVPIAVPAFAASQIPEPKSNRLLIVLVLIAIAAIFLVIVAVVLSKAAAKPANGSKAQRSALECPQFASGNKITSSI